MMQMVISTASIEPIMNPTVKHSNMAHLILSFSIFIVTLQRGWPIV